MNDAGPQRTPREQEAVRTPPTAPEEHEPAGADPVGPAPLHVPRTPTGNAGVDALLERLADADHLATEGHLEVYEDVHRGLRDALTALDVRPGPPASVGHPAATPRPGPSARPSDPPYRQGS